MDSGFGLGFVVDPLARSAVVWCKPFVFSSLPIRKVLVLVLVPGRFYPQTRRSYYLFFTTCSLLLVYVRCFTGTAGFGCAVFHRNGGVWLCGVSPWKTSSDHRKLWKTLNRLVGSPRSAGVAHAHLRLRNRLAFRIDDPAVEQFPFLQVQAHPVRFVFNDLDTDVLGNEGVEGGMEGVEGQRINTPGSVE